MLGGVHEDILGEIATAGGMRWRAREWSNELTPVPMGADFELTQWYAMVAPAGTPAAIIATLNAAVRNALTDPKVVKRFANDGGMPAPTTPEGLAEFIRNDTAAYARIAEKAGIKTE